jgi:serine/threonine-protein kinase
MNRTPLSRIEELFHAALDRPAAEREAFLAAEPDAELRTQVLRLLDRHTESDAVFTGALDAALRQSTPQREHIGPYRLLRELGAGGMGTVYLAERTLGDTVQHVALKLIRGFPTADARQRFARERSLLAGLNHPNIAGLLDGGDSVDGQPYLVMEYVEGKPLLEYCRNAGLDLRARLRLFAQLCAAVQHAHQRLIVHRDIKPGNVLVRDDGAPVLLDFGIGKLLDATQPDTTATRVFTPAYAAPEQRAGRTVTTASDIFSLGCVLFELLTDRSVAEAVAAEQPLPAPSTQVADRSQARGLRGDLDTLVLTAAHPEPERRYASAQALAEDVENYLCGRPLNAVADSRLYRLRKFCARHRFGVAVSALALIVAAAFVWRLIVERERAEVAETTAQREAQSARRSRDFLISLFEAASPGNTLGHALSARELIDKGSEHLAQELKEEPDTAARLSLTIAQVYAALGDPKAALVSGERALALATGGTRERALLRAEILVTLGSEYDNTERFDDARRADEQALALRERYAPEDRAKIASTLTDLGSAAVRRDDLKAARAYFDRAIDEFSKLPKIDPVEQAQVLRGLAEVDVNEGKLDDSVKHAEQAVNALASLPAASPERIEPWRVLARAEVARGDVVAATATLEHALDVAHAALGEDSYKVSNVENDLAVALNSLDRYRDAIGHLQKSIAIAEKLRPGDRAAAGFDRMNLGSIQESLGDYAAAEHTMREAIATIEAETPDEPQLDFFRGNLARTLMLRGDFTGARTLVERALTGIAARDGEKSFGYAFQQYRLARIEVAAGNVDAAEQAANDAYKTLDPLLPPQHALRVQFTMLRGLIARDRGKLDVAQRELEAAEKAQEALQSHDPIALAAIRRYLAGVYLARGDLPAARRALDAALPVLEQTLLPQAVELVDAHRYADELARREKAAPAH